jgi:HPt (histidine-containing phosphotransfer) domain-containing protein
MSRHYNLDKVYEIAEGDDGFVTAIIKTFLEEIPSDLAYLQSAIANNNHSMAYQFAHKMKPNLEMFGVHLLGHIKQIEQWSDTNMPAKAVQSKLDGITEVLTKVFAELREEL